MPPRRSALRRSEDGGSKGTGRARARPPPRRGAASECREEVDRHAVGVAQLGVALTPERVPRLLLTVEARCDHARVQLVDLLWGAALEGKRELVPGRAGPVRPEARDDL